MKIMKRLLSLLLALSLMVAYVPLRTVQVEAARNTTEFAGGSGTEEDPYLISTKEHLNNVREYLDAHFKMIDDIEFTEADFTEGGAFYNDGAGWEPIVGFQGVFDGNFYSIKNLCISRATNNVGLFGLLKDVSASIKNVSLEDCNITGNGQVGGIVGYVNAKGSQYVVIENCYVSGNIVGTGKNIGGICGCYYIYHESSNNTFDVNGIKRCVNNAYVVGNERVGGIVGRVGAGTCYGDVIISECQNNGNVRANKSSAGGIVGESYGYHASGSYTWVAGSIITDSYNTGEIAATESYAGGIVGYRDEGLLDIDNVYSIALSVKLVGGQRGYGAFSTNNSYCLGEQTSGQLKLQSTYKNWDFNGVWTMTGDSDYPYPELRCLSLQGTVAISGKCVYNATVKPDLTNINRVDTPF